MWLKRAVIMTSWARESQQALIILTVDGCENFNHTDIQGLAFLSHIMHTVLNPIRGTWFWRINKSLPYKKLYIRYAILNFFIFLSVQSLNNNTYNIPSDFRLLIICKRKLFTIKAPCN